MFHDVEQVLFGESVELGAMLFERNKRFFKLCHILFAPHHFDDIVAAHDAKFRAQGSQHPQVRIVGAEKGLRVSLFKDEMFFYHVVFFL